MSVQKIKKLLKLLRIPTDAELRAMRMKRILSKPVLTEVPEVWADLPAFKTPNEEFSYTLPPGLRALLRRSKPIPRVSYKKSP